MKIKNKNYSDHQHLTFEELAKLAILIRRGEYLLVDIDSGKIAYRIDRVKHADRRGLILRFDYKNMVIFEDEEIIVESDNTFHTVLGNHYKVVENNAVSVSQILSEKTAL